MFVPGAVKYLGVNGLLSLGVPGKTDVVGQENSIVKRVAQAANANDSFRWHDSREALLAAISQSLTQ